MATKNQGEAGMNLAELQAELRHFAAERDWQPFHTPKNLSTALMVEAAELAEIFQWMTPEESRLAHEDAGLKQRIGEEVADVLLYLLQLADHSEIDIAQAVRDKLARNALKYPATRAVARVSPKRAAMPGTHVLLDYENVQPTEDELRAMVPDASPVWVFHGPHQRRVEQRFASFGADVTAVPISKPAVLLQRGDMRPCRLRRTRIRIHRQNAPIAGYRRKDAAENKLGLRIWSIPP
jgi:NTP pyrophosphatase (non-canonical NTP hydrolase)